MYEHVFDSESGDFRNKDAAKCISDGSINANQRERGIERVVFVEFNSEILSKMSFAGLVLTE